MNKPTDTYIIKGILTNYGFCLKKALCSIKSLNSIKSYFNVKPVQLYENDQSNKEDTTSFEVYYEDEIYLVIPKFMGNSTININFTDENKVKYKKINFQVTKTSYKQKSSSFKFTGKLRDYQIEIIEKVLRNLNIKIIDAEITNISEEEKNKNNPLGGIIELSVGMGKTLLAIYLAHILKLKTLVIVNQEFLQDQWIERFKGFTDAKIGKIQGKTLDIENKDVVIGMVQSISMKDYEDSVFKEFGLVIYDEVHHYGSRVFSQALMKTAAKYTIGLTATLERSDGMVKLINWFVGNTLCKMSRDRNYRVLVKKINFRSSEKTFIEKKRWIMGSIKPDHKTMVENLLSNSYRNKLIINMINNLKERGRTIFVISEQIKHLEILKTSIDTLIKEANQQHIYNTYYYIQLASEALDIPRLDTIILTNPIKVKMDKDNKDSSDKSTEDLKIKKKRITQTIGRILRSENLNSLTDIPVVIDICDILSIYKKWGEKREEYYFKNNWFVQDFGWHDDKYLYRGKDDKTAEPLNIMFNDIEDEDFIQKNLIIKKEEKKEDNIKSDPDE